MTEQQGFDPTAASAAGAEQVEVDFSGTNDEFTQLEDGWYLFRLDTATAKEDNGGPLLSKKGSPMIRWISKVLEGPRAGAPMYQYTVTKGEGAFGLRKFLSQAFGAKLGKEPQVLNLGVYIGQQFWGQVGPQKNDPQYKDFKAFRLANDPPPNTTNAVPAGIASRI